MTALTLLNLPEIDANERSMPRRIPQAAHRHAAPSGPWPWEDLLHDDKPFMLPELDEDDFRTTHRHRQSTASTSASHIWRKYPGLFFGNWTKSRLERSGIAKIIQKKSGVNSTNCVVYHIDVGHDGHFSEPGEYLVTGDNPGEFWDLLQQAQIEPSRVRILFVENISGNVLQMLGAMYRIEPFFFSSSLNWIPSRYQEEIQANQGDHITVTLTFLKTMPNPTTAPNTPSSGGQFFQQMASKIGTATIDTQAPLILRSNDRILLLDLLAFHMVRRKDGSTIISYHPDPEWKSTTARFLHSRVRFAGESVYWQSIFKRSPDPTLVVLCMLWYALYAWDEALENLYIHVSWLESRVLVTNDINLTRELHIIRASLLHYTSLLESFRKTVMFIRNTPNPALEDSSDLAESTKLMERETDTLVSEIERLEMFRKMQEMRLENIMNLAFSSVNFHDSRVMQRLSEDTLRDGAAMKQIAYLTMVFLPASFVATVFGMNISSLQDGSHGTVARYLAVTFPLTALTIWVIMALHTSKTHQEDPETGFLHRLRWPITALLKSWHDRRRRGTKQADVGVV